MKMSDPPVRNDIELPPAVHWPTVYVMAGIGGGLVAVLLAVIVIAAVHPAPPQPAEPVVEVRPAPPPRPANQVSKPAASVEAPSSEPPLWKPLVPPPAPVFTPVAVKPLITLPDLDAVLDRSTATATAPIPPGLAPVTSLPEIQVRYARDLHAFVREIDLDTDPKARETLLASIGPRPFDEPRGDSASPKRDKDELENLVANLFAQRTDLAGLPVRDKSERRLSEDAAKYLQTVSQVVRRAQARADRANRDAASPATDGSYKRAQSLVAALAKEKEWTKDDFAPGLAQMLCVEDEPVRLQLTKMLDAIKGRKASVALARQALFDPDTQVRQAAIQALQSRPCEEYRQTLVDGFRYPLPAVADRAATALTAVDDREAVLALSRLLGLPDPAGPVLNEKKQWEVAEVVKVNHLRNCLLCHAPSAKENDPVRGFVPKPGEEIPVAYYASPEGDFVRADVTFLKQDFSVMEAVPDPGKWPAMQRFDFLVRRRELTDKEVCDLSDAAPSKKSYPQREALLAALAKLNRAAAHTDENAKQGP